MSKYNETPAQATARHLEADRVNIAAGVESDRVDVAANIEADRVGTAEDVEVTRKELARILEADRKRHNTRTEARLAERTKLINRRFLFLFGAIVLVFGLLAYRAERVSADVEQRFHDACVVRQERQVQANVGRETMVQLVLAAPTAPTDQAARDQMTRQLRDALLLPVETCD